MIPLLSKARAAHLKLGNRGERIAERLLRMKKMDILARNYKCKAGEIDIVARDGAVLVFVEVKTRRAKSRARPAAGLTPNQKERITRAGRRYLYDIESPEIVCRYDLIEVVLSGRGVKELRHWPNHIRQGKPWI